MTTRFGKLRIVETANHRFKIQKRTWIGWRDTFSNCPNDFCLHSMTDYDAPLNIFNSKQEADQYIAKAHEKQEMYAKWREEDRLKETQESQIINVWK